MSTTPLNALHELEGIIRDYENIFERIYDQTTGIDAHDCVKRRRDAASQAKAAANSLRAWINDGSHNCQKCRDRDLDSTPNLPPESCTCFLGHAPCSFCVGSMECGCGEVFYNPDGKEGDVCSSCETQPNEKLQQELSQMMRDPRYWRDRDPAFIKQVTDGYRALYDNEEAR